MVKANELRIGNIVQRNSYFKICNQMTEESFLTDDYPEKIKRRILISEDHEVQIVTDGRMMWCRVDYEPLMSYSIETAINNSFELTATAKDVIIKNLRERKIII